MESIIDKITTLRNWHRTNQIKTHKGRHSDDLNTLLNQIELDVTKRIKNLETICDIAKVPNEVMRYFSSSEIGQNDIYWAKEKIIELSKCDHNWIFAKQSQEILFCTNCGAYKPTKD